MQTRTQKRRRGGKGYAIMIDSESGADSSVYIDVKVKKRTTYQLNAWIKTEGLKPLRGGRGAQLNLHALPDQPRTAAIKGDKDWTKVSVTFKTDDRGTVGINCLYGGWGFATGKAYWDDIELIQIDAGQGPDISEDTESIVAANLYRHASTVHDHYLMSLDNTERVLKFMEIRKPWNGLSLKVSL